MQLVDRRARCRCASGRSCSPTPTRIRDQARQPDLAFPLGMARPHVAEVVEEAQVVSGKSWGAVASPEFAPGRIRRSPPRLHAHLRGSASACSTSPAHQVFERLPREVGRADALARPAGRTGACSVVIQSSCVIKARPAEETRLMSENPVEQRPTAWRPAGSAGASRRRPAGRIACSVADLEGVRTYWCSPGVS